MSEHENRRSTDTSELSDSTRIRFTAREIIAVGIFLLSLGATGVGIYAGITSRLDVQAEVFKGAMNVQQTQIQGVKDAVDDLKKRLDLHEQRTWKDGRQ